MCTAVPSEDHTYCYTQSQLQGDLSPRSSIDEEYEFGAEDLEDDIEEDDEDEDEENDDDGGEWDGNVPVKNGTAFEQSSYGLDYQDSEHSDTDFEEGGSDGEQRSRVRGLIVKMPRLKRKQKASSTPPLHKKHISDAEVENERSFAGADALLNLASAALALRDYTPTNSNNNNYDKFPVEFIKKEAEEDL